MSSLCLLVSLSGKRKYHVPTNDCLSINNFTCYQINFGLHLSNGEDRYLTLATTFLVKVIFFYTVGVALSPTNCMDNAGGKISHFPLFLPFRLIGSVLNGKMYVLLGWQFVIHIGLYFNLKVFQQPPRYEELGKIQNKNSLNIF